MREYKSERLFNIKYFSHFVHVLWLWYNQCWSGTLLRAWDRMSCTYVLKLFDSLFHKFHKNYWCLGYTDQPISFRPPVPGRQHNSWCSSVCINEIVFTGPGFAPLSCSVCWYGEEGGQVACHLRITNQSYIQENTNVTVPVTATQNAAPILQSSGENGWEWQSFITCRKIYNMSDPCIIHNRPL